MIRRVNPSHDDDDDDHHDDGIPPEILEMMKMTEAMLGLGSPMGGGPRIRIRQVGGPDFQAKRKPEEPRFEESSSDIMARMDRLS